MKLELDSKLHLLGAPAELAAELHAHFTVDNPLFVAARKTGRYTGNLVSHLHFCEVENGGLTMPRGAATVVWRQAREYGPVEIADNRLVLPEIDLSFSGTLRLYQQQACNGAMDSSMPVEEAGTGSGKTVMACAIISARKQPTLVLVHNKELLHQWHERIKQFLGVVPGMIGDGKFDVRPLTVAIVNTARNRLNELVPRFGHVVVDECHRVPATTFTETITAFSSRYLLGLSATPYRRDGLGDLISWFVGLHRMRVDMTTLHEVGAVLRPKIVARPTEFRWNYEDDYQDMISALVNDQDRNHIIARDIRELSEKGGLSLVVSDRTAHLQALAEMADVGGEILTGKTPAKKRREIVERLSGGDVPVLFSTLSLIGEGFDCPSMDSLFLTTPIKSEGRLKQVVGRVLRPAEGKTPIVYDYVDNQVGVLNHQAKARQRIYAAM